VEHCIAEVAVSGGVSRHAMDHVDGIPGGSAAFTGRRRIRTIAAV
jgi:hypothetical protein